MAVILTLILCIAPGAGASIALPAVADPGLITVPDPLPGSPDSPLAFRYDAATGTWQGQNTVQRTDIAVTTDGLVLLASPNGTAVLRLAGIGRESLADFPAGTIRADGDRLEIGRGTATEWYVNHETGIEQEMTLGARPSGTGDLQIAFDLSGDLRPALLAGQVLLLSDGHGPVLTYGGLVATDAGGNVLPSEMVLDGTRLFWQVDDRDAVYPVSIDPVIAPASSAKVQFTGGAADDEFGISVALSSDGSTALIGADYNSTAGDYAGAAYVFEKKDGTWESGATARFTGSAADDVFGYSVALSSDGSTALIGAVDNSTAGDYAGAAYVFEKGAGWESASASAATARFTGGAKNDSFGWSVALSSDGSMALIGAPGNDTAGSNAGAAYVFEKGAGWESASASAAMARFTGGAADDVFGYSVALSSDGSTALIGAWYNSTAGSNAGAAYIFEKDGVWKDASASAATARFTGGAADDVFGYSVALSSDGSTALIGAVDNSTAGDYAGAAYVFEKGAGWVSAPASAATAQFTGGAADEAFGYSVALSSDGSTALIGAVDNSTAGDYAGAAYVFEKGAGWESAPASAATARFTGGAVYDEFGYSAALSSDGSTALIGAVDNSTAGDYAGAAYVFQQPFVTLTAGGTTKGTTGTSVDGLTLNPTGTVTNADLFLGTSPTDVTGSAVTTRIGDLPSGTTTTVNNADLDGKAPGTYYLILRENGGTTILAATRSAEYTVTAAGAKGANPSGGSDSGGPADPHNPPMKALVEKSQQSVSVNAGQIGHTSIIRVGITGIGVRDIVVTATEVNGPGTGIPPAPGIVYEYVDITPAHFTGITASDIHFSVPLSWLEEHGLTPEDIVLYHYTGTAWEPLETVPERIEGDRAYYSASGTSFSRFAISGQANSSEGGVNATAPAGTAKTIGDLANEGGTAVSTYSAPPSESSPAAVPTTVAPPPAHGGEDPPETILLILAAGCVVAGVALTVRRWWIRRQNPALFRNSD